MERSVIDSLLVKTGVSEKDCKAITDIERAKTKLQKRLTAGGVPSDASTDEMALVTELGIDPATVGIANVKTRKEGAKAVVEKPKTVKPDKGSVSKPTKDKTKSKKADKGPKKESGADKLRKMLLGLGSKSIEKGKLVEELVAAGMKESGAINYVVWSQRPIDDRVKNPIGIQIVQKAGEKGEKLMSVSKVAKDIEDAFKSAKSK